MRFTLLPQQDKFFGLFKSSADNLVEASNKLVDLMENYENVPEKVAEIKRLEGKGDQIIHDIMTELHNSFITPLDREDIAALGERLDDVVDCVEEAARYMLEYRIEAPTESAKDLSKIIVSCAKTLAEAMDILGTGSRNFKKLMPLKNDLNLLENDADQVTSRAVGELFETFDAIDIIKWKEVYAQLENAADSAEDIAGILEGIVIKHG